MSTFKAAPTTPIDDAASLMTAVTGGGETAGWVYFVMALVVLGLAAYLGGRLFDSLGD